MHDEIKKFSLEGEVRESNVVQDRERLIHSLENIMRDYGYVPSLDNDPQFTLDYQPDSETFNFEVSIYGVKVGKEDSWHVSGVTSGKTIQKYIHQPKLRLV